MKTKLEAAYAGVLQEERQTRKKRKKGKRKAGGGGGEGSELPDVSSPLVNGHRRSSLEGVAAAPAAAAARSQATPKSEKGLIGVAKPVSTGQVGARLATSSDSDELIDEGKPVSPWGQIGARHASKLREKRMAVLQRAESREDEDGKGAGAGSREEQEGRKENESAPSPAAAAPTPKVSKKKQKTAVTDSLPSPSVSSSTTTTPKSNKKKKKKKRGGEEATEDMEAASPLDSNGNGVEKAEEGKEENGESVADAWPTMEACVPAKEEERSEERRRLKAARRLKKQHAAVEAEQPPEPTVPKDTVPKAKKAIVPKDTVPPTPSPTVPKAKKATVPPTPSPTVPNAKKATVSKPEAPTVHPKKATVPSPTVSMRDTVRQLVQGGVRSPSRPSHIRFASESPIKPIDNGRAEEGGDEETRKIGRMIKDSSPEVSTTSSESDDDGKTKKERKKKLTKKPEVTSSKKVATPPSKMTPITPSTTAKPSKMTSSTPIKASLQQKSPVEEKMKDEGGKKKKDKKGKTKIMPDSEKEEQLRPSPDLLQMVAERLVNGHGLLVFRLISQETRRIAERHMRAADSTLHLEEFDDENAFTRDDMTAWWEQRREGEDTTVGEGKENRAHAQISAYLSARSVEKQLLTDMDGGLSHPGSAAAAVDPSQLLQHPLETLDAACLLHESQGVAAARFLQQEGRKLREVWLGHCSAKLVRELKRLPSIERFEHRAATMETMERLPMLQITELRLDLVDESVTRNGLADHLVNGQSLRVLELNVAPTGPNDGNTSSHYSLFTKRSYDRGDYTDDLEWMIPNVEDGEPDPVTLCMPSLEHLATNVGNVKLFWQLRDSTQLLRHLLSLRVGTLSTTKELIASSELFADTKESRRYKQPGFFALRDAYETVLESVTLRLADRVGMCRLAREAATMFEAIGELPPSLRRLSVSLFHNQFSGVCAPFRKWAEPEAEAPDTDHIGIEEVHLHFERAFDLRGLPSLLPRSIRTLSLAVNYETEDDARCLGAFLEMLPALERLEQLEDLHVQVWGVRCLQPLIAALSASPLLAGRLRRLAVAAYPVGEGLFEPSAFSSFLRSTLSAFPLVRTLGLHATVLARMIPAERRRGYAWRNGLAWLANQSLGSFVGGEGEGGGRNGHLDEVELAASPALPVLDCGEDYTITPHWQVDYDATQLVLSPEDEEEREENGDVSYSIAHGTSDEDDAWITDGEDEEDHADASRDDLDRMEEGLEEETERIERRESRRDERVRAAIERGELPEGEEEEGEVIDFEAISDQEEDEEPQRKSEFFDDEAVESDREESEEGEAEEEQEESADSYCSSEDDDKEREEERKQEEARKQKRIERKQAKLDDAVENRKRKRAFESDEEEDDEVVIGRRAPNKRKKVIIESDDE